MKDFSAKALATKFYQRPTVVVSRDLLGKLLIHDTVDGTAAGRIVETESYLFQNDPACHASRGETGRNKAMFGKPGHAYIYLIYGIHYCFNAVTAPEGVGEAVLIRALEPTYGLSLMARRRGMESIKQLTSGPGKLCQALAIDKNQNGVDLTSGALYIADDGYVPGEITTATRIGISVAVDLPLRFYLTGNPFVSRK